MNSPNAGWLNLSRLKSEASISNKVGRVLWALIYSIFFRPSLRPFHAWRRMILRLFGAKIGKRARIYPSARIWAPWNFSIGDYSVLGDWVDCYSVGQINIGSNCVISQYSYLCSATHDPDDPSFPLKIAAITIGNGAWVAADAFIGPGVTVGDGAVVGARASAFSDVASNAIVGGNPAKIIRTRA